MADKVIDFTKYNPNIQWTLANGFNIYIWNRMLQDHERAIQSEEKKLLSPPIVRYKGKPMTEEEIIYDICKPNNSNMDPKVHFASTPNGEDYFYDQYIQSLNKRKVPAFTWPRPKQDGEIKIAGRDFPDYSANITMADIPSLVNEMDAGSGKAGLRNDSGINSGCPQHNSKEESQQKKSWVDSCDGGVRKEPLRPEELWWPYWR